MMLIAEKVPSFPFKVGLLNCGVGGKFLYSEGETSVAPDNPSSERLLEDSIEVLVFGEITGIDLGGVRYVELV